jgi:hypothetical protein
MIRRLGVLTVFGLLAMVPGIAEAQGRYGRTGGYVNTPFGAYSMQQMMAGGGSIFGADEVQQYQMMLQQQQMMQKQMQMQQQYMKQMQAQQKNQPTQPLADSGSFGPATTAPKKKKRPTYNPGGKKAVSSKTVTKPSATTPAKAESADAEKTATKP